MERIIDIIKSEMNECQEEKKIAEENGRYTDAEYWYGKYKGLELSIFIISGNK